MSPPLRQTRFKPSVSRKPPAYFNDDRDDSVMKLRQPSNQLKFHLNFLHEAFDGGSHIDFPRTAGPISKG